jgi:hypothetical protein
MGPGSENLHCEFISADLSKFFDVIKPTMMLAAKLADNVIKRLSISMWVFGPKISRMLGHA